MSAQRKLSVVDNTLSDPPYPADTRARGWRFELEPERLVTSDTWDLAQADMRPWLLMLWFTAWRQSPCGSLPAEDDMVAAKIGMPVRVFSANRDILMRGWYRCSDGRLYHAVITELVERMRDGRKSERDKKARQRSQEDQPLTPNVPGDNLGTPGGVPGESTGSPATGTGTGTGTGEKKEEPTVLLVASADADPTNPPSKGFKVSPCPTQEIVDLYHQHLPGLPAVAVLNQSRRTAISARWREVCGADKLDRKGGLDFFGWFFPHVASSDFLMGRVAGKSGRVWKADLDFLMTAGKFPKVIEGSYHQPPGAQS